MTIVKAIQAASASWWLVAAAIASVHLPPANAVTAPESAAESDLVKAEDALFAADVTHDIAAIKRGFADEAVFVHANGLRQTKADYLAAARDTGLRVRDVVGRDRVIRIFGDVGVIRGTKTLTVGDDMHLSGTYLAVYVRREDRWQLLDEQSSPEPRPPGQH